ncbi:MAG: hypothetical protein EP329_24690 [Deltaproteobacteria bacterium]|nr:MAG: hypothetical protein EP329_24690 [Deltaproteobacteria bacterium]
MRLAPPLAPWLITGLALALSGCPQFDDHGPAIPTLGPVAVGDQLLTADQYDQSLVAVSVDAGRVEAIKRIPLAGEPSLLAALPDQRGVLVLERDTETLERVSVPDGAVTTFEVGAAFEGLSISPDSSAAIAYFPPGTATAVFHNANEIAYVDLDPSTPPEEAVVRRTLASLGGAPLAVYPSPELNGRRFAFVLSEEHVAILDLADPTARERSVPLVSLNTGGQRTPKDIRFEVDETGDEPALWAVITTLEGNSVYALRVFDSVPEEAEGASFDVRLTQLAGFTSGGDVSLTQLPDGRLVSLMVSPANGTATVTYLENGNSDTVQLGAGVNRLDTYFEEGRPIAVIYRSGGTAFHILDIGAIEEKKDKAFRTRYANHAIQSLLPIPNTAFFVAFHNDTDEAVSVINADTDRVTSFGRTGYVRDVILSQELGRLYLLTRVDSADYLVNVQLGNFHPTAAPVPNGASRLLLLPGVGTVATSADLVGGQLVLWPADVTTEDTAYAVPAYLLDGLLDRAAN